MKKPDNPIIKEVFRNFALISQLGFSVIISILVFVFGAVYIDKKLNTNGNLIVVGIALGVIVGIMAAYRLVKKHFKD